jgi:hypothetical protein
MYHLVVLFGFRVTCVPTVGLARQPISNVVQLSSCGTWEKKKEKKREIERVSVKQVRGKRQTQATNLESG